MQSLLKPLFTKQNFKILIGSQNCFYLKIIIGIWRLYHSSYCHIET